METKTPEQSHLVNGLEEQDYSGIDLSHLWANLRLTPMERLAKQRRAHERWMEVERAAAAAGFRRHPRRPEV